MKKRQAVVLIHGIGEQKPMDTLRGFVDSICRFPDGKPMTFYSNPDDLSENFDLRRLTVYANKYRTDFFEYYWAHNLRGTKFVHLTMWLFALLWRLPKNVPKRIRWIYYLIWVLSVSYVALTVVGLWEFVSIKEVLTAPIVTLIGGVVLNMLTFIAIYYLGDAARYTYPSPENISDRQKIRSEGVKLLKKIHATKKYDRIVLVGHSLGTMIAYDILKHLWGQYHKTHSNEIVLSRTVLEEYEKHFANDTSTWKEERKAEHIKIQSELHDEQMAMGNKWLISDFITLGSPLAHSALLMADSMMEMEQRKAERELPTCPPVTEEKKISYPVNYKAEDPLTKAHVERTTYCVHHAGHFAFTRWHNFYYAKDFVGGELSDVLGKGIIDKEVRTTNSFRNAIPFLNHTLYWGEVGKKNIINAESIGHLRRIILETVPQKAGTKTKAEKVKAEKIRES